MKLKFFVKSLLIAMGLLFFSCEESQSPTDQKTDPTGGREFPRKLILTYEIGGFWHKMDTSVYEYEYLDGRISTIKRNTRKWDTNGVALGKLEFAGTDIELIEFAYNSKEVIMSVTLNGNNNGLFIFEFDDDNYVYPKAFKKYTAQGVLEGENLLTYEKNGFLTRRFSTFLADPVELSISSGNILQPYQNTQVIKYTEEISTICQFTGFTYFTYKSFGSFGSIDPISITFKWFRPSKNLIGFFGLGLNVAKYSYTYSNGKLVAISSVLNGDEYVAWKALMEY